MRHPRAKTFRLAAVTAGQVKFDKNEENTNALPSAVIFQWQPNEQFVQVLGNIPGNKTIINPKPPWAG